MAIIIMNLLVGLAVDDIKAVQDQAVLKRLAMQVRRPWNGFGRVLVYKHCFLPLITDSG